MNIDGLEKITLAELQHIYSADKMSIKEAVPFMREFRDKNHLDDKQALKAFGVAKMIFGNA